MAATFTSGSWTVKPGEETEFVEEWKLFVGWAAELPGSGAFRLVQDRERPDQYTSFGEWESREAQEAWTQHPEFRERLGRVRSHCSDFESTMFELVATVS
jgi:heme-degrading monooxygenase HmoA